MFGGLSFAKQAVAVTEFVWTISRGGHRSNLAATVVFHNALR
jgi:hypothetical protein